MKPLLSIVVAIVSLTPVYCFANPDQEPLYTPDFANPAAYIKSNMTTARQLNRTIFNPALYTRIREVWFGTLPWGAKVADQASTTRWFTASGDDKANFDKICYNEFNPAIEALSPSKFEAKGVAEHVITAPFVSEIYRGGGNDGLESTKTALSLMILLDQVPRNLYRTNDTLKLVYEHYDLLAVSLARHIARTTPRIDLHPTIRHSIIYRQWFYLPLMHSEKIEDHDLFSEIVEETRREVEGDENATKSVKTTVDFEKMHRDILDKFGRYPHRHECLGRTPTEEEREFLKEGGHTFGVAG
jgi:uncharacterized protein (DUF924 family)